MNQAQARKNLILDFINQNESVSNRNIVQYLEQLNLFPSRVTIERDLDEFIAEGLIEQIGAGRSVQYKKAEQASVIILVEETSKDCPC